MNVDKKAQIQAYARAIAALLYEETDPEVDVRVSRTGTISDVKLW
jgi:hypothetical protein